MSEKGHFIASADVVEAKAPSPLPPPLTRVYDSEQLVKPLEQDAVEIEAVELETAESDELELDVSEASDATGEVGSVTASACLSPDDHLRNIMDSFQRAVTPPAVDVSQLLPRFDGPQLKFPMPEAGS